MPNFNGAIVVHTLQVLKAPATLREIVATIAKNTELPHEDLIKPVKQTLDMGVRVGYLQKLNGRYFLVAMTFDTLKAEMQAIRERVPGSSRLADAGDKHEPKSKGNSKKEPHLKQDASGKQQRLSDSLSAILDNTSTTTLTPMESPEPKRQPQPESPQQQQQQQQQQEQRKPKRLQLPIK